MLTGGCLCGGVRYEITEPLTTASYCHCTRCQRRSGTAASANAEVPPGALRIVSGEELVKAWTPPDHGWDKCFCSNCGAALWSQSREDPDKRGIRLGTLDHDDGQDPGVTFTHRQFVAYAVPWEPIPNDGLERYPEGRR
jgi:hypothetical protein